MTDDATKTTISPFNAPWSLYFERDGTEDVGVISDADGKELLRSRHFWLPEGDDPEPSTLAAMRLIQASPGLLEALRGIIDYAENEASSLESLKDSPEAEAEAERAWRAIEVAHAAIDSATTPGPVTLAPVVITEDEFDERFPLLTNHLNPNASWGSGKDGGCLFATHGEELEFVRSQDPRTVWTLVDGDWMDMHVLNGFHYFNRIGYLVSTVPLPGGRDIVVYIPLDDD